MLRSAKALLYPLKILLLFRAYPEFSWILLNIAAASPSPPDSEITTLYSWIAPLKLATYIVIAIGVAFLLAVPLWSAHYQKRPGDLHLAFKRGLFIVSVWVAIILPIQGLLVALSLVVNSPSELWFWGIFAAGGTIGATIALLERGVVSQPGICMTLRAMRIDTTSHPKLHAELTEVTQALGMPIPRHVLVGLQPELISTVGTVFCPDGELKGGVLCLSLPTSSILSIPEFRALVGETLVYLHTPVSESREQFISVTQGAEDVLRDLQETMKTWTWIPKWFIHPYFMVFWIIVVAAMRFPLYLGKELLTFYLKEVWTSRETLDSRHLVEAHLKAVKDVGAVQVLSALMKEAAVSLGLCFKIHSQTQTPHPLGEIAARIAQEHPQLEFETKLWGWKDPVSAWQHLQARCNLSGKNLDWCRQMALEVSPSPPASSLFEHAEALNARLLAIMNEPFVMARGRRCKRSQPAYSKVSSLPESLPMNSPLQIPTLLC